MIRPDSSGSALEYAKSMPKKVAFHYREFAGYFMEGRRNNDLRYQIDSPLDRQLSLLEHRKGCPHDLAGISEKENP
jgi:hypothetical protein